MDYMPCRRPVQIRLSSFTLWDSAHIQRGWMLSIGHAVPYALASGGMVVLPGQLINHWAPPSPGEVILAPQGRVQSWEYCANRCHFSWATVNSSSPSELVRGQKEERLRLPFSNIQTSGWFELKIYRNDDVLKQLKKSLINFYRNFSNYSSSMIHYNTVCPLYSKLSFYMKKIW